jgi:hypothetical protein
MNRAKILATLIFETKGLDLLCLEPTKEGLRYCLKIIYMKPTLEDGKPIGGPYTCTLRVAKASGCRDQGPVTVWEGNQ